MFVHNARVINYVRWQRSVQKQTATVTMAWKDERIAVQLEHKFAYV